MDSKKDEAYSQNDDDLNLALALSMCPENDFEIKSENEILNNNSKKENITIENDEDVNLALLLSLNSDSDFDENEEVIDSNNKKDNFFSKNDKNLDNASARSMDLERDFEENDEFISDPKKNEEFFKQIDEDLDYALALSLQTDPDNAVFGNTSREKKFIKNPSKNNQNSTNECRSLIDKEWELIDPTPDIHALFLEFNAKYFWNALETVVVRWSQRMTLCAGVCCYQGRGGLCSISLSLPLLKLRPRKDLVETLLHEMIHAYLFVTHNNRDRTGHGPEFLKHMHRINKESGAHITVYHSFHDEVDSYRKHWWKCNGPCQKRSPFFGLVKRAMNRAPSNLDFWWAEHQEKCGGTFTKIKEPENYKKKGAKRKLDLNGTKIDKYFSQNEQISGAEKFKGTKTTFNNERKPNHSNIHTLNSFKEDQTPLSCLNKRNDIASKNFSKETTLIPFKGQGFLLGSSSQGPYDDKRNINSFQVQQKSNKNVAIVSPNNPTKFSRFKTKGSKTSNISSLKTMTGTRTASGSKTLVISHKAKDTTASASSTVQQMPSFPGTGHILGSTASTSKEQIPESLSPKNDSKNRMPKQSPINKYFKTNEKLNVKKEYNLDGNNVMHNNQHHSVPAVPPKDAKVKCPSCNILVISEMINSHLDYCLK